MIYIYKDGYAIGWVDGDGREIMFATPIPQDMLSGS